MIKNRTIFTRDNLEVLRGMSDDSVDLIYLDPPFNSNHNYAAPIGSQAAGAAFKDVWGLEDVDLAWHGEIEDKYPGLYKLLGAVREIAGDSMTAYLIYMSVRVMEMKRVLKNTGSIYLHCDPTASHYLKLMMDEVFGRKNFRNEIAWKRSNPKNDSVTRFGKIGDRILFYSLHPKSTWNPPYEEHTKEHVEKSYKYEDERGRFMTAPLHASSGQTGRGYDYEFHGHFRTWVYPLESMKDLEAEGRVYLPKKRGGGSTKEGLPSRN